MVAARGFQETAENGDRFLVLMDGRRYEGEPGTAEYKIYQFERYAMRIEIEGGQGGARAHHQVDADPGAARRPGARQPGGAVLARRAAGERAASSRCSPSRCRSSTRAPGAR